MDLNRDKASGVYVQLNQLLNCRYQAKKLKLFNNRVANNQLLGETRSHFRGLGMEFEEVRPYHPGDDIRALDWRVLARTGKPYTKLFREEQERPIHLIIDQRSTMFFGSADSFKSVVAAQVAALLAWAALSGSDRIGGQVFTEARHQDIRAKRNRQAVLSLLQALYESNHSLPLTAIAEPLTLSSILEESRRICRPGSAVFIVSDCYGFDDNSRKQFGLLAAHCDLTIMYISDHLEQQLPALKGFNSNLAISDGDQQSLISFNSKLLQKYHIQKQQQWQYLRNTCNRYQSSLFQIKTTDSPFKALLRIYR